MTTMIRGNLEDPNNRAVCALRKPEPRFRFSSKNTTDFSNMCMHYVKRVVSRMIAVSTSPRTFRATNMMPGVLPTPRSCVTETRPSASTLENGGQSKQCQSWNAVVFQGRKHKLPESFTTRLKVSPALLVRDVTIELQ